MTDRATQTEVLRAAQTLYDVVSVTTEDLKTLLEEDRLTKAFRKKIYQSHPDRSVALGVDEALLERRSRAINAAYELLVRIARDPEELIISARARRPRPPSKPTKQGARRSAPPPRPRRTRQARYQRRPQDAPRQPPQPPRQPPQPPPQRQPPHPQEEERASSSRDFFYSGAIPPRRLRIGEFLFFRRDISWKTLIKAISWQSRNRPKVGKIAVDWGYMSEAQVENLLVRRLKEGARKTPFCSYAEQRGFLSGYQRLTLLGRQHSLQSPFGRYLIETGHLNETDLARALDALREHNIKSWTR